jgi:hypothetical protein
MLLEPKPAPEDLGTVRQGLGDPGPPQPVHSCIRPPYTRRETYPFAPVYGVASAEADLANGELWTHGDCMATAFFHAQAAIATAWVGHDFPVPAGITSWTTTVGYDFDFSGYGIAILGVAVVNLDMAISIDKRDGTPRDISAQSVSLLTVPFAGGDGFNHKGSVNVTIPFSSNGSNGTVRVMVGIDGHCAAVAFTAEADFWARAFVREICVNSNV